MGIENQSKACPTSFDHFRDLFRGKLSINQVILSNIHLRMEMMTSTWTRIDYHRLKIVTSHIRTLTALLREQLMYASQ